MNEPSVEAQPPSGYVQKAMELADEYGDTRIMVSRGRLPRAEVDEARESLRLHLESAFPKKVEASPAEPCPLYDGRPETTCKNRHQCWEPCGELGKSAEHTVRASLEITAHINHALSETASPAEEGRDAADARRYRWLRGEADTCWYPPGYNGNPNCYWQIEFLSSVHESLDAAVDAAITATKEPRNAK